MFGNHVTYDVKVSIDGYEALKHFRKIVQPAFPSTCSERWMNFAHYLHLSLLSAAVKIQPFNKKKYKYVLFCLTYKYSKTSHSIHQKVFTTDNVSSHDRLQCVDFDQRWWVDVSPCPPLKPHSHGAKAKIFFDVCPVFFDRYQPIGTYPKFTLMAHSHGLNPIEYRDQDWHQSKSRGPTKSKEKISKFCPKTGVIKMDT